MGSDLMNMSAHAGHDMSGHDMSGHDMSGHEGHDMSGHSGHSMDLQDAHAGHGMQEGSGNSHGSGHSPFVYMSGGHGDGVLQAGVSEVLLFKGASTDSPASLFAACLVLLILAVLLEYLRLLAWWLEARYVKCSGGRRDDGDAITACNGKGGGQDAAATSRTASDRLVSTEHPKYDALKNGSSSQAKKSAGKSPSEYRFSLVSWGGLGLIHILSYVWSTCLMLITMTFNIYLIVAIALGVSIGKLATMYTRAKLFPSRKAA